MLLEVPGEQRFATGVGGVAHPDAIFGVLVEDHLRGKSPVVLLMALADPDHRHDGMSSVRTTMTRSPSRVVTSARAVPATCASESPFQAAANSTGRNSEPGSSVIKSRAILPTP